VSIAGPLARKWNKKESEKTKGTKRRRKIGFRHVGREGDIPLHFAEKPFASSKNKKTGEKGSFFSKERRCTDGHERKVRCQEV